MDNRDSDPPESGNDPSLDDPPSSTRRKAARPTEDASATTITREALHAYIELPETMAMVRALVARKVPLQDVDNVAQDARADVLAANGLPASEARLPGWVRTFTRRAIARYYANKKAREEVEELTDVPDEYVDPSTDIGFDVDGVLIRPWLKKQVAGNARDEQLFAILMDKARTGATYAQLAARHGLTLAALTARLFQFKKKCEPRYRRYRNGMLLILLGGIAVVAIAIWLLRARLLQHEPSPPPRAVPAAVPAPPHDPGKDVSRPNPGP